jgi:haloalkane dehalogenase
MKVLRTLRAEGRKHVTIAGGGHFLQEDKPDEIARVIDAFIRETR